MSLFIYLFISEDEAKKKSLVTIFRKKVSVDFRLHKNVMSVYFRVELFVGPLPALGL